MDKHSRHYQRIALELVYLGAMTMTAYVNLRSVSVKVVAANGIHLCLDEGIHQLPGASFLSIQETVNEWSCGELGLIV